MAKAPTVLPPRAAAARIVAAVEANGESLSASGPQWLATVARGERALAQELAYGSLRQRPRLQFLRTHLLPRPTRDAEVYALVLVGLYEIEHLRTPPHAAVNATVEACRALKKPWATGLLNATLREFLRTRSQLLADHCTRADPVFDLAHPQWLIDRLRGDWPEQWAAILAANNGRAPLSLRVNTRHSTRAEYARLLDERGLEHRSGRHGASCIVLATPVPVEQLPGFAAGWASVQDEAAQLAAELLAPPPGGRVLDACAAPGGKAAHLAEIAPSVAVLALDRDPARLDRARANFQRLHLGIEAQVADAAQPDGWWDGRHFDRILLDAPCSATGIIRRRPDIKTLRRDSDIDNFAKLQDQLLDALWPLLATGGSMLYSTCSVLAAENATRIRAFLDRQPQARLKSIVADWGCDTGFGRQIRPGQDDMDGFFYALLEKHPPQGATRE